MDAKDLDGFAERLAELRGEPLVMRPESKDIPCKETSDPEKLCRNPVVTVVMLAYNHGPYIDKAIESVAGQKADFEFEILLCEDCSNDGTREKCFEAQKRYPDKIRLLWHDMNVNSLGGNSRRADGRARGEFIAYCEGDDWWSDPLKLAKQLSLMRKHPSATLCLGGTDYLYEGTGKTDPFRPEMSPPELVPGEEVARRVLFGAALTGGLYKNSRHTSTQFVRRAALELAQRKYEPFFRWNLRFGDTRVLAALSSLGDVCFLPECVSVYRINPTGITQRDASRLMRDADVFGIGFSAKAFGIGFDEALDVFSDKLAWHWVKALKRMDAAARKSAAEKIAASRLLGGVFRRWHCRLLLRSLLKGRLRGIGFTLARAVFLAGATARKRVKRRKYIDGRIG